MLLSLNCGVPFSCVLRRESGRLLWQFCGCDSSASARDGAKAEATALALRILTSAILLSIDAARRDCRLTGVGGLHSRLLNLATIARVAVHWVSQWSHTNATAWLLLIEVVLALRVWHLLLQELLIVILLLGIAMVLLLVAMRLGSLL